MSCQYKKMIKNKTNIRTKESTNLLGPPVHLEWIGICCHGWINESDYQGGEEIVC
jgi:hypothetical protein